MDADHVQNEDVARAKSILRLKARAARRAIADEARELAAVAIADRVLELPQLMAAAGVMVYGASQEEADPGTIEARLRARGVRIAYPRVNGIRSLSIHWVDEPGALVSGPFGLLEPGPDLPEASLGRIAAIIVPGIAFDAEGNRLGYGGGYYDSLLAGTGLPLTVGIAYDEQIVGAVPHDGRDRPVDVVVTPTRTLRAPTTRP